MERNTKHNNDQFLNELTGNSMSRSQVRSSLRNSEDDADRPRRSFEAKAAGESNSETADRMRKERQARALKAKQERQRKTKRNILIAVIAVAIIVLIILIATRCDKKREVVVDEGPIKTIKVEREACEILELYTFGTHLNMSGNLPSGIEPSTSDIDLILLGAETISIPIEILPSGSFRISELLNDGYYLDPTPCGEYNMYIRVAPKASGSAENADADEKGYFAGIKEPDYTYYPLDNNSGYPETVYYTMSSYGNVIIIKDSDGSFSEEYLASLTAETEATGKNKKKAEEQKKEEAMKAAAESKAAEKAQKKNKKNTDEPETEEDLSYTTIKMTVQESTNDGVYDIVIDPGHGGEDLGAPNYGNFEYNEIDLNTPLAEKIKELLEAEGVKVKLTREADQLAEDEQLPNYGVHGRTVISGEVKAKYLISLHMNSKEGMDGLELYTPGNINYDFARTLGENIQNATGLGTSPDPAFCYEDFLYTRMFDADDVAESIAEDRNAGLSPFEYTTKAVYYYIIREPGGIVTGAYHDERQGEEQYNPYWNSNTGCEAYITELGFIVNQGDVDLMVNKMDEYAKAIADSILAVYR